MVVAVVRHGDEARGPLGRDEQRLGAGPEHAVPSLQLRAVDRKVRLVDQLVRVGAVLRVAGDTDRDRGANRLARGLDVEGALGDRWIRNSGVSANGTSQGFEFQNAYTATPSAASTRSVATYSASNSPVSRKLKPRASRSITASSVWLTATKTRQAATPAIERRSAPFEMPACSSSTTRPMPHAAIADRR